MLAYTFGLRHAFDADHIAAIDNTTRKLLQEGKRPLGVGFFFSLGHSTIVFGLAIGLALAAHDASTRASRRSRPTAATIGDERVGTFLWLIGILNLLVLIDIVRIFREHARGELDEERLEAAAARARLHEPLLHRPPRARGSRRAGRCTRSASLFGLGFDTATEVALLAIAAGVATHHVPFLAVISLPLLFAAGMSLMDTADGAFMSHAYGWAFANPVRKVYYNITVTSLSVAVALVIGTVELLQVLDVSLDRLLGS